MKKTLLKLSSYSIFLFALTTKLSASICEDNMSKACGNMISSDPSFSSTPCFVSGAFTTGGASTSGKVISAVGCNFTVTRLAADSSIVGDTDRNLYSVRLNQPFCGSISVVVWQSESPTATTPIQAIVKSVSSCGFIIAADINSTVTFFAIPTT